MATLSLIMTKLFSPAQRKDPGSARMHRIPVAQDYRLRPMPNEEVHLFIKPIDNSRVVPMHNPANETENTKRVAVGALAVIAAIFLVAPAYMNKSLSSQIAQIEAAQNKPNSEMRLLEVKEAELLSPKSLQQFAQSLALNEPTKDQSFVLGETDLEGSYAMNRATNRTKTNK